MIGTRTRHALALIMAVPAVLVLLLPGAMGSACRDFSSCSACRNTTLCHWCASDQQCHAKGSLHGCVYGTYCYNNDQCERPAPEYHGYAAPSIAVLLGVCLVGGTAIFCAMASLSVAREYANQSAASRARAAYLSRPTPSVPESTSIRPNGYMMLSGDGDYDGDAAESEFITPEARAEAEASVETNKKGAARAQTTRRWRPERREANVSGPTPLARKVLRITRVVATTGIAVVLLCCTGVVMFAPHTPQISICNTEFDWGSIVNSLKKISLETDFQILVSIYNPNMLDAEIDSGTAILYHKHEQVGTMVFNPSFLSGGYITDVLLTITFDGEAWEEARIGLEYETGTLAFLMDATVSASILWHGFKTYPFTFNINNYYIKVSNAVKYDRSLCNCSQMLQGKRLPQIVPPPLEDDAERDKQTADLPLLVGDEAMAIQRR